MGSRRPLAHTGKADGGYGREGRGDKKASCTVEAVAVAALRRMQGPPTLPSDRPATARAERGLRAIDVHPSVRGRVDVRALGHFWRPTFGDDSATGGPYGGRGVQFSASAGASKLHPRRAGTTIIARRAPVSQDKKYDSVQSLTTIDLDTGSQPLARRERELMQAFSTTTRSASDCVGPTNRHRGEGR